MADQITPNRPLPAPVVRPPNFGESSLPTSDNPSPEGPSQSPSIAGDGKPLGSGNYYYKGSTQTGVPGSQVPIGGQAQTCPEPLTTCTPCEAPQSGALQSTPPPIEPPSEIPQIPPMGVDLPGLQNAIATGIKSGFTDLGDAVVQIVTALSKLGDSLNQTLNQVQQTTQGASGTILGQCQTALSQCQSVVNKCDSNCQSQINTIMGTALGNLSACVCQMQQPPSGPQPGAFGGPEPAGGGAPPIQFGGPPPQQGIGGQLGTPPNQPIGANANITVNVTTPQGSYAPINIKINANATANALAVAIANAVQNQVQNPPPIQPPQAKPTPAKPENVQVTQTVSEECCPPDPMLVKLPGKPPADNYKDPVCAESMFAWVSGPKVIVQGLDCWSVTQADCIAIVDTDGHPVLP